MGHAPLTGGLTSTPSPCPFWTHTHTSVCAHSKAHFYAFFFFLMPADYIHESCVYFSGGRKTLLSRPISWSHCAAASLCLYFHPGIQKIISFLLQLLGGRGKKKIHRGGPIYRHTKAEHSFSFSTGSTWVSSSKPPCWTKVTSAARL